MTVHVRKNSTGNKKSKKHDITPNTTSTSNEILDTDAKKLPTVTIFGMSTEGYNVARQAAIDGATVYIVDESDSTAISLSPEIARAYPSISTLKEDEPIMLIERLQIAVSKANYLFFAPRIRSNEHNIKSNMQSLFKDAIEYISEGTSVVFCVPIGIDDGEKYVAILEHVTGFKINTQVFYYYHPLESRRLPSQFIGGDVARIDLRLGLLLSTGSKSTTPKFVSMCAAEHKHALDIISRFANICSIIELGDSTPNDAASELVIDPRIQNLNIDLILDGMLDLRVLILSLENAKSLRRMAEIYLKTVTSYVRHLADHVQYVIRDHNLKRSRVKIILLWKFDSNLLRGDHSEMCNFFLERLQGWVVDVELYSELPRDLNSLQMPVIIIPCTTNDLEAAKLATKELPNMIVMNTNPVLERKNLTL